MIEILSGILLICGAGFMLVASIGVVKFPDVYGRMHAITKAASLGLIMMLAAVILLHSIPIVWTEALMAVFFVVLTAPVGTHMIARVAYQQNPPNFEVDDLKNHRQ